MYMYLGKRPFDREQLVFVVEVILKGVMDEVDHLAPHNICRYNVDSIKPMGQHIYFYPTGYSLAVLYAQLTDDGMSADDALVCADNFDEACKSFLASAWADGGEAVWKEEQRRRGTSYTVESLYDNYPDTRKHAEFFVDRVFREYLDLI